MNSCSFLTWVFLSLIISTSFNQSKAKQAEQISDIVKLDHLPNKAHKWVNQMKTSLHAHVKFAVEIPIAGVLCFLAAAVSSAGGIGGGGLFIPILVIVAGLDLKTAMSFSAFMVMAGSLANVFCNVFIINSKIDIDIALSSEPCMLLGVSAGVICNQIFPESLITVSFAIFLSWSTFKTLRSGIRHWKTESEARRSKRTGELENGFERNKSFGQCEEPGTARTPILGRQGHCRFGGIPMMKLGMLTIIWLSFFLIFIVRGNRNGQSIIRIKPCGVEYWILSSLQIPLALIFTVWILLRTEINRNQNLIHQEVEAEIKGKIPNKLMFPVMALLAGIFGGVFGIGGGMLISPILLQIGVAPEVTAATCSFMVFFSSSMSSSQYLLLGMDHTTAALMFAAACFLGSLLGLLVVQRAIKKYGRPSLIIFSIGTVMAFSAVLLTSSRASNILKEIKAGNYMSFKSPCE
ncbi:hypothetical protein Nepgr_007203 [Nepenthes gracilis]|uniref:Sulfite exporter TauE/SafE family protein n=1 Tax=Nepenthes gracilis TaxID=150966 RepID=A0AAD3S6M0_NEPGR|nr:hypothetical protein Nepgr_007203 [Nepenthes gracilis]